MAKFLVFALVVAVIGAVSCRRYGKEKEWPCKSDMSLKCMRKFFREHAECKVVEHPKEHPSYELNLPIYLSKIDTMVITTQTTIYPVDLEGAIETFYVDHKTHKVIITVNPKGFFCDAPGSIIAVYQNGDEPKVVEDYINATYPAIITAVIDMKPEEGITANSLKTALVSAFFEENNPIFNIGPKFSASEDPVISKAFSGLLADIPTALREILVTKAYYFFSSFLQTQICDFGVEPNVQTPIDTTVVNNILSSDSEGSYTEPCADSDDVRACVADYFVQQGHCNAVTPDDEPVYRESLFSSAPFVNTTAHPKEATLEGFNTGIIKNFCINKETNNLIMTVAFDAIVLNSDDVPIIISQRGQEPKVISDVNHDTYPVTLTAVIPLNDGLTEAAIKNAIVSPNFQKTPVFKFEDNYQSIKDKDAAAVMKGLAEEPLTISKELYATEARSQFRAYLQKYICDYGLSLSLVDSE